MSRIWLDIVCGERRCQDEKGKDCQHWIFRHGMNACELFGALRMPEQIGERSVPIRLDACIQHAMPEHGPRPDARSEAIAQAFWSGALEAILERVEVLERQIGAINTALLSHAGQIDKLEKQVNSPVVSEILNKLSERLAKSEKRISEVDESHDRIIDRSCERLDALEQSQEWARKNFELKGREGT